MEFERKAILRDKTKVMDVIKKKDFVFNGENHQVDTYFSTPNKEDFKDKYLRVRQDLINNRASIDFHIVKNDLATEEFESDVDKAEIMIHILKEVGMQILCIVDKKRIIYQNNKISIIFDHVKGLGDFIEIEVQTDNEGYAKDIINNLFLEFGISSSDIIAGKGYPDLILEKNIGTQKGDDYGN